jgi:hypothetical protein
MAVMYDAGSTRISMGMTIIETVPETIGAKEYIEANTLIILKWY